MLTIWCQLLEYPHQRQWLKLPVVRNQLDGINPIDEMCEYQIFQFHMLYVIFNLVFRQKKGMTIH